MSIFVHYHQHIFAKKKCSFYESPGICCNNECSLRAGHDETTEKCICSKPKNVHICNQNCQFYKKSNSCQQFCSLPMQHNGDHNCIILIENHRCNKRCHLYGTDENCQINCTLQCLHNGICKCNYNHLCKEDCSLNGAKENSCHKKCVKKYDHEGDHLCDIDSIAHLCPNQCFFYRDDYLNNTTRGDCRKYCNLPYNHDGNCNCGAQHPCNNKCKFYPNSGGCNKDCSKEYLHDGDCICNIERKYHLCKEKCNLCEENCGHVYNHKNEQNIDCFKCLGNCKLVGKSHLCGNTHDCPNKCQENGFCIIESFARSEEDKAHYQSLSGQTIEYKISKLQRKVHANCRIKIQKNEFAHLNHSCQSERHKCGFQCKQCEYYCTEDYGHNGLHKCIHGNIKNSFFKTSDLNDANVLKDEKYYKFKDGESAKIYFCDGYCREQGQGHTHLFESNDIINNNANVRLYNENSGNRIYECKCEYFWKEILNYETNFTDEEKKKFSLCDWMCTNKTHIIREFCIQDLWHRPIEGDIVPNDLDGNWVSRGHVFKCSHPKGIFVIFLVDQSGSMSDESIKPTTDISTKLNNMLGASIEAIIDFCNKRRGINEKDRGTLIGFNNDASLIFENIKLGDIDTIKKECITKLSPKGGTSFLNAFKEASIQLNKVSDDNYHKIIILLSDGLDGSPNETLNYIKNDLMIKERCKIFCIYFKPENTERPNNNIFSIFFRSKNDEKWAEDLLREIAKIGGTENYFNSNSLANLCETFGKISDAIQINYKLKLNSSFE